MRIPTAKVRPALTTIALCLVLAGCGSADSADPVAKPEPPATTSLPATTSTSSTTQSPGIEIPGAGEPWDVLLIAHPRYLGVDTASRYAELIEDALGVEVRIEQPGGIEPFATVILGHIRNERHPSIADLVRDAEIIVFAAFPQRSDDVSLPTPIDDAANNCAYYFLEPPTPIGPDYWDAYHAVLDEVYGEIWRLRASAPTVLIAVDYPNVYVERQREAGILPECAAWFTSLSAASRNRAEASGAVFVSVHDAVGGPNHDIDPLSAGLTGPSEEHPTLWFGTPNETGSALVASLLIEAGLRPMVGPNR